MNSFTVVVFAAVLSIASAGFLHGGVATYAAPAIVAAPVVRTIAAPIATSYAHTYAHTYAAPAVVRTVAAPIAHTYSHAIAAPAVVHAPVATYATAYAAQPAYASYAGISNIGYAAPAFRSW